MFDESGAEETLSEEILDNKSQLRIREEVLNSATKRNLSRSEFQSKYLRNEQLFVTRVRSYKKLQHREASKWQSDTQKVL